MRILRWQDILEISPCILGVDIRHRVVEITSMPQNEIRIIVLTRIIV